MGVDIHLNIIKETEIIAENIYDGRNSEWFNNLQLRGNSDVYDTFPAKYGIPEICPDEIRKDFDERDYYGFHYLAVREYIDWYIKQSPDLEAGWVSRYDAWQMEIGRNFEPYEYYHRLPEDANLNDWAFKQWTKPYCNETWLYNYLIDNKINRNAIIIYYFDC